MSESTGYRPVIRSGSTDGGDINERLNDDNDTFPYTSSEDGIISEEAFVEHDRALCKLIYTGLTLVDQVQLYTTVQNNIIRHGNTMDMQTYSSIYLDREVSTAYEALAETQATLTKIFVKISEYISTTITVFDKWLRSVTDLQKRSVQHISSMSDMTHISEDVYDVSDGGSPSYKQLYGVLSANKQLVEVLSKLDKHNPTMIFLSKFIKLVSELMSNQPSSDDKFEEMVTSEVVFDDLATLQDYFNVVGISFDGSEAASFSDVLTYDQKSLPELGYTTDSFKQLVAVCTTDEQLSKCKILISVLQKLNDTFKSTKRIDSLDDSSIEKFKSILENLPNILTLVISIYRNAIVSSRYYTTMLQDLLSSIHNKG